ncbi:hypothetical protein GJ744_001165 [Endocarpon pusillum]|uniref:HMG box domain-containing protein n=1 Tax=Endocarpon pusillum TaxID=364733 RepID=A0A8H7AHD4_9EURO|nr:hypothetical protein GJ744_001165 [Endocarpon pusillum]
MASVNTGPVAGLPESHRNSPLAPSQEMAYRQKCIDLKRRLSEIETNNDNLHQKLKRERRFQDKMRLNRAILLNHMKELVENPMKRLGPGEMNEMKEMSAQSRGRMTAVQDNKGNSFAFDDSSEMSSSDEVQEPDERPLRIKRAHDGTPRISTPVKPTSASETPLAATSTAMPAYHSSGLPHIMPANAFSPAASAQSLDPHTSLPRVTSSTSNPTPVPLQPHPAPHQAHHHSPTPIHQTTAPALPPAAAVDASLPPPPPRPTPPFDQFTAHLVPQLQADNIPPSEIGPKIRETWNSIGEAGQEPWQRKYREEMMTYERTMDEWKRAQREGSRGTKFVNGSGGGFSAVNR